MKKNMNKEQAQREIIKLYKDAEDYLYALASKAGELRDVHESPYILQDIIKLKKTGKVKVITTSWIQRRFRIGYARTADLMDVLKKKKIIK